MIFVYYKNTNSIDKYDIKSLFNLKKYINIFYINNDCLLDVNNNKQFFNKKSRKYYILKK